MVLELVRPWRFPIRELPFEQKKHQEQEQQQQQGEKVAKKSSFSMGFRSYIREFFGAVLELVRPSEARCFPPAGDFFEAVLLQQRQLKNHPFLWVSEVTLGSFLVRFWNLFVLQRHGVFPRQVIFRSCFTAAAAGNRSCRKMLFF